MSEPLWGKDEWRAEAFRQQAEVERLSRAYLAECNEVERLREREAHFARVLSVTDGGQYRHDWDSKLTGLVAEVERLREERDRWIRAYNALDGAIKNHREAYEDNPTRMFVEDADEGLWKRRDKTNSEMAASGEQA